LGRGEKVLTEGGSRGFTSPHVRSDFYTALKGEGEAGGGEFLEKKESTLEVSHHQLMRKS